MSVYDNLFGDVQISRFYRCTQTFDSQRIDDIADAMKAELAKSGLLGKSMPGLSVSLMKTRL